MRTFTFRGVLALAVLLTLSAAPALAQSIVRGKVVDAQNKPVDGATVAIESVDTNRKVTTKTDKKGEFTQIGLQTGDYKVTVSKDKVGTDTKPAHISQGRPLELSFTLAAGGPAPDDKAAAELRATAQGAIDALHAGNNDEAIAKFNDVIAKVPTCGDCYYNLGVAYTNKKQYDDAVTAFNKAIEIKPSAEAYTGLANVYNAQKKFDLAGQASSKAAELSAGTPGGGGGAEASYNQGVILFNSQKFAEAKTAFEAAVKADPNMALAHYQLGMTALNLGQIPQAVDALQTYLKLDPNGPKAAEVKAALPALQQMVNKK